MALQTPKHKHACSCESCISPRRRFAAFVPLAVLILGLAHGWLHFANTDRHGHFADHGNECCLVQNLGGGTAPVVLELPLPQFVSLGFFVPDAYEFCGRLPCIGYSPRDPPIA